MLKEPGHQDTYDQTVGSPVLSEDRCEDGSKLRGYPLPDAECCATEAFLITIRPSSQVLEAAISPRPDFTAIQLHV